VSENTQANAGKCLPSTPVAPAHHSDLCTLPTESETVGVALSMQPAFRSTHVSQPDVNIQGSTGTDHLRPPKTGSKFGLPLLSDPPSTLSLTDFQQIEMAIRSLVSPPSLRPAPHFKRPLFRPYRPSRHNRLPVPPRQLSNALLQVLTTRDTFAGTTKRSLPARRDSSAPYSALPKERISSRTGEGQRNYFCLEPGKAILPNRAKTLVPTIVLFPMLVPAKTPVPSLLAANTNFVVSKIRMDDRSSCAKSVFSDI
jgi:hypothetical protein